MISNKVTALTAAMTAVAAMLLAAPEASADQVWVQMPLCENEDGNLDGKTCLWIDPDTGKGYVSLSEAYWDPF